MITHLHFTGKVHLWLLKPEVSNLQITIKMIFSDGQETLPKLRLHCPTRLPVGTEPTPFQITVIISSLHPSCLVLLPKTPLVQLILTASKYFPFNQQVLTIRVSHFGVIFLNDLASSRDGCLSHSGTRKIQVFYVLCRYLPAIFYFCVVQLQFDGKI